MKKCMSFIACLMILCLCGNAMAELTYSTDGSFPICSEPVHLTVGVPDNTLIEDWETNNTTKLLLERGNFDLDFITYDSKDYKSKINIMVMGGGDELPDVLFFTSVDDSTVYQWALEGAIIPLTQYYNDPTISYWFHEAEKRTGVNIAAQITAPDGEIYGIPTLNQSYSNEYPHKATYYAPWLEKLGADVPETTDELYELFKTICSSDMNGNGKADEVALSGTWGGTYDGWFAWLMNSFIYAGDASFFTVNDGVVSAAYTTNEWREGLKYIAKMFAEGLIPLETLTQDTAGYRAMYDLEGPAVFMEVSFSPYGWNGNGPYVPDFLNLCPMKGPEGVQYATYRPSVASISFLVSKNCKNPEAAFRLGDLMCSANLSIVTRWGEEGVNWDYIENVPDKEKYIANVPGWPVYLVAYDDQAYWKGGVQNAGYRQTGPYIREYAIANGSGKTPEMRTKVVENYTYAYYLYQESGWNPAQVIPKLIYTVEETDAISEIRSALLDYVKASTAAFLAGNKDVNDDAQWDAFVKECYNIGLEKVLDVVNTVYSRMYE